MDDLIYTPNPVPTNRDDLDRYLRDEFERIRSQIPHIFGDWYDLLAPIVSAGRRGAASDFDWTDYNATGIYQPSFALNEDGIANFHINHDIKRGSLMYPHMHWSTDGTNTNPVHWELNYISAARDDLAASPFGTKITKTLIGTPSGTAFSHVVTETNEANAQLALEVDSIILMQVKRVTNGATDNTDTVFGHFVDFHYQRERLGTPNKAPDFYKGEGRGF